MSRLYLITGFLGAGKTTFLKKMLKMFSNQRVHVIVNEFGKEGVDGELLGEIGVVVDEINNGSIFCSCRLDKFEEVLGDVLKEKPDIILVEASGLSDPTNVRKILHQKDKFPDVEYMGSICLIDAQQFLKVYETATVVKKQLNVSDMVLLNKKDLVLKEQLEMAKKRIYAHRPDVSVHETVYADMRMEWLTQLKNKKEECEGELFQSAEITLRKYILYIKKNTKLATLENFLKMIMDDTFRIKGFVYTERTWYLINCVGNIFCAEPYGEKKEKGDNKLVVLSGYGLPVKKAIKKAMQWYPDVVEKME